MSVVTEARRTPPRSVRSHSRPPRRTSRSCVRASRRRAGPTKEPVDDQSQGVQLATIQALARYWATEYDWRKCEARLKALPQFVTEIDGLDIHFIHVRSEHEDALPLIVTHGWPGSILEQLKIIDPLTNPTAHGGSASDAFHLVIPSLPGFGFSGKPTTTGWDPPRIARAWTVLMKRLGYTRFVGARRRLGWNGRRCHGYAGASGIARHSPHLALHGSTGHRPGDPDRQPAAIRPLRRRTTRVRAAGLLLHARPGLRPGDDEPPADDLRNGGFARWPCRLAHRPRHAQLRADRTRLRRPGRGPHARRRARQHHALLADEHGRLLGAHLLGEQVTPSSRRSTSPSRPR